MDSALFDDLQQTLKTGGPNAAIERLCASLRDRKDYTNLFYALLLKKRHELGVPPVPTGSATELPQEVHAVYEEAIRQAGRMVGKLYLDEGNIPQAWINKTPLKTFGGLNIIFIIFSSLKYYQNYQQLHKNIISNLLHNCK